MDLRMRFRETRGVRRVFNQIERAPEHPRIPSVRGPAGSGKTTTLKEACRRNRYPVTLSEAFRGFLDKARPASLRDLVQLAHDCGLARSENGDAASNWFMVKIVRYDRGLGRRSLNVHEDMDPRVELVKFDRTLAAEWIKEYARETKQALDPEKPQLLMGNASVRWHFHYVRARVMDTANLVLTDLGREFLGGRTPHGLSHRRYIVEQALTSLKVVVLFDDAHVWRPDVLSWLPELHDVGARFVLSGTQALFDRIHRNASLKPLATRLGPVVELLPPTLEEIHQALPALDRSVAARAWTRSGRNLRVLGSIVAELERAAELAPARRISVQLVDDIADLLPASRPAAACDVVDEDPEVAVAAKAGGDPRHRPSLRAGVAG